MRIKTLDIGGGTNSYKNEEEDITYMDYYAVGSDYVKHDAESIPYPFKDNTFDKINASHILEHLSNLWREKEIDCVFDELWRILKEDGELIVLMPHSSVCYSWSHPTHKRTAGINSLNFLEESSIEKYTLKSWELLNKKLRYTRLGFFGKFVTFIANINSKMQYISERFLCNYVGGFDEVYYKLKPLKTK